jgi:hypothetical protein
LANAFVFNNEIEKEGGNTSAGCRSPAWITTDLVEAFLKCPTKCFLRARAEVATGNAYADWVRTKSEVFRSEGITRLVAGVAPDKCATSTAATESGRSAQWQLALDFTAGGENLRCSFDAVERKPASRQMGFPGPVFS